MKSLIFMMYNLISLMLRIMMEVLAAVFQMAVYRCVSTVRKGARALRLAIAGSIGLRKMLIMLYTALVLGISRLVKRN